MIDTVYDTFDFRVLRENRRVNVDAERASESEEFHAVLSDVALGVTTERVKKFVIDAYVRGARVGCAENTEFEGSTSVFTKRRYRHAHCFLSSYTRAKMERFVHVRVCCASLKVDMML